MSKLKRKDAPGGVPPPKSAKKTTQSRPSNADAEAPAKSSAKASTVDQSAAAPLLAALKDDQQPLFPRGGGSLLTPLEQKQIQLRAKADALREDEFDTAGKSALKAPSKSKARPKKTTTTASKSTLTRSGRAAPAEETAKIESLGFKKLLTGSLVLAQVTRIHQLELEMSLPNNLSGRVSIVDISDQLTARLQNHPDALAPHEADADAIPDDGSDADTPNDGPLSLSSIYLVGQYLRLAVISTTTANSKAAAARKQIQLTMRPSETNAGLSEDDVVPHTTLMAAVISVEERGCLMDVAVAKLRAFLPLTEIDPDFDRERLQTGAVFLCTVTGKASNGKLVQLSLLQKKLGSVNKVPLDATTINSFLPGTPLSLILSHADRRGIAGKAMGGHLDVSADIVHSAIKPPAADAEADAEPSHKLGSKLKARVICNFPAAKNPKLAVSMLPHVLSLNRMYSESDPNNLPTTLLPLSTIVDKCRVDHVEGEIGLFVDTGIAGLRGFVHISRVKDGKVDALHESSGPYRVGSIHRGRVVGYSELDGIFQLSLQKSILDQQYIRLEDVPVGAIVHGEIEKMVIGPEGVSGLIVRLAQGITGFVSQHHLSDVRLQHPEKKFREGLKVKARVLSTDLVKKKMLLTLKKTIVNSEAPVVRSYGDVRVGMQVLGTIIRLLPKGAQVQFYGSLKGFLPVSEMSEAYIRDPAEHFRVGQVVGLHVLDLDAQKKRLIVSCKDPSAFGLEKQSALKKLRVGDVVSAKVTQKTEDQVFVELVDGQLKATLPVGHLTDKSASKNQHALKRIAAGQTLSDLVVIEKVDNRRLINLSQKPTLVEAAKAGKLLSSFDEAAVGAVVAGFVRNITPTAVFVQFGAGLTAIMPKARLPADVQLQPDFGMRKQDSIQVKIASVVPDLRRILVLPLSTAPDQVDTVPKVEKPAPADGLTVGSVVEARVTSVKQTQLNVQLVGSQTQGRIDVSQLFDAWDDIPDPKKPLSGYHRSMVIKAKVIGVHDARDHRFLPISHRSTHSLLELTAKPNDLSAEVAPQPLSLDSLQVGDSRVVFVNNVCPQFLWVNLSPSVRGRISRMDASDDLSLLNHLEENFPVGSALKAKVTAIDVEKKRLDLSARSLTTAGTELASLGALQPNMVLPGRITKVDGRQVLVKLSEQVFGPVHLPDMSDNYDEINTLDYKKNDIVRVSVVEVDASSQRLRLSLRPSRIMSSTLPVTDREISNLSQLAVDDVVRGFVKNVSDKGLFVLLGGAVTALVKVTNLSDRFLKEWKENFQVDQLVKGRVIALDTNLGQVELSLKSSVVDEDYRPPLTYSSIKKGDVLTGRVRKVEVFGAFILVDNSANVSGLCHRSQMAEKSVKDATKLYKEGDVVKALVLDVDSEKRRVSFGLKPSLFDDDDDDNDDNVRHAIQDADSDSDGSGSGVMLADAADEEDSEGEEGDGDVEMADADDTAAANGLGFGRGSAWSGDPFEESGTEGDDESAEESEASKRKQKQAKRKRKTAELQVDRTAELDAVGPRTASDYERLLLGQPDSSELWIAYMAFQMQVSELAKARQIAERAIKSINVREEREKLNVWLAYLNLEVTYGNKETVEEIFRRACQYNDEREVHERLASIYIQSEKFQEAEKMMEVMVKKFGASHPGVWINYGHFLHVTRKDAARARALLPRALRQLDGRHKQMMICRFAALEYRSPSGEPERGRTMFEGLLATWPKKGDLWNQLLDLEKGLATGAADEVAAVRDVFERRTRIKGLKPQQAEKWFRRWADWEAERDAGGRDRVMAKAQEWAAAYKARREAEAAQEAMEANAGE